MQRTPVSTEVLRMPERFPDAVSQVLSAAGWSQDRNADAQATEAVAVVEQQVGRNGARLQSFEAVDKVLAEFCGVLVVQDGPGVDLRRRPFAFEPSEVAASTETLAELGRLLGTRLFPIGLEGDHDSIIAMDESGRVFALDHAGAWFLGDSIEAALITLITGTLPPRLDDDGAW